MIFLRNHLGPLAFWILGLFPLAFWFSLQPLDTRFGSLSTWMTSIGQMAGLVGMALFALNLILSARLKFLEPYFGGMNRVYVSHHFAGTIAFILLLIHPLALALRFVPLSVAAATEFLFGNWTDLPTMLGKAALALMTTFLVITFFAHWKYEHWKISHQWLGFAFFLGGLHAFFVPSDIAHHLPLRAYMFALAALGLSAYLYRTVLKLYRRAEYLYTVTRVSPVNAKTIAIELSPLAAPMTFAPGQFAFIRFPGAAVVPETHPFSITAAPTNAGVLSFGIKALGDFTETVNTLKPGTEARIEGPFGMFSYLYAPFKKQVWLAGGIGITPFLGMARDLDMHTRAEFAISLFYAVRNRSEAAFLEELLAIAGRNPNFQVTPFYSETGGAISARYIADAVHSLTEHGVYLCGPHSFMRALREQFVRVGVPNRHIYSEEFKLL